MDEVEVDNERREVPPRLPAAAPFFKRFYRKEEEIRKRGLLFGDVVDWDWMRPASIRDRQASHPSMDGLWMWSVSD
jgi:hypothetical protein